MKAMEYAAIQADFVTPSRNKGSFGLRGTCALTVPILLQFEEGISRLQHQAGGSTDCFVIRASQPSEAVKSGQ